MKQSHAMQRGQATAALVIGAVIVLLLIGGGVAYVMNRTATDTRVTVPLTSPLALPSTPVTAVSSPTPSASPSPVSLTGSPSPTGSPAALGAVRTVAVTSKPFAFTPTEIRVKQGERVKIALTNESGTHDWVIDEFSARTDILQPGQTDEVEFTATKAGTFEYYCSVGNHRQMGMKGKLIVE